MELPSQEEAERTTQNWNSYMAEQKSSQTSNEKRTWASYLPNALQPGQKQEKNQDQTTTSTDADKPEQDPTTEKSDRRTWAEYASTYVPPAPTLPSLPALPSIPDTWLPRLRTRDADARASPVLAADGSVDEPATRAKQEREVSVLLDQLDMSSINNRVFALSAETQKVAERFARVLRDTLDGVPTAYDDLEALMRDAGPQLERQWKALPPFVQSLVKSLPAKLGGLAGTEALATAATASAEVDGNEGGKGRGKKKGKGKRRLVPSLKSLLSKEGAIAGMLRSTVKFLQVRFPFLASATNVVMSLAIFILMFVFWYCHKRGKEVRLAKEAEAEAAALAAEDDDDDDSDEEDDDDADDLKASKSTLPDEKHLSTATKQEKLADPEPEIAPLPVD